MGITIGPRAAYSPVQTQLLTGRTELEKPRRQYLQLEQFRDGFESSSSALAPAAKQASLTTDSKGFPTGTVPVKDGQVEVPGLGVFPAPAPGKKSKLKLPGGKHNLVLRRNPDGSVSVQVKKRGGFFSKLGSFFKKVGQMALKALPIISKVIGFIPGLNFLAAPLQLASKVVSSVQNGIQSLKGGGA